MNAKEKFGIALFIPMILLFIYGNYLLGDFPIDVLFPEQKTGLAIMVIGSIFVAYGLGIWVGADQSEDKAKEE